MCLTLRAMPAPFFLASLSVSLRLSVSPSHRRSFACDTSRPTVSQVTVEFEAAEARDPRGGGGGGGGMREGFEAG